MIVVGVDEYKDMIKMTAIEWAQVMEPEYDLQVADVCEVNCIYGKENVTYAVNFIEGVTSNGYALVELVDGEPVVTEARIVPGEEGIRTKIAEVAYNKYDVPSVEIIRTKLSQNKTISMNFEINSYDEHGAPAVLGHAITILGVKNAKKVSSGNSWNYLMVANGWDGFTTYLNYSTVDFVTCSMSCFYIN